MFNKLRQTQNKDKCLDPLKFLPIELAEMVCEYLAMRDRVYDYFHMFIIPIRSLV